MAGHYCGVVRAVVGTLLLILVCLLAALSGLRQIPGYQYHGDSTPSLDLDFRPYTSYQYDRARAQIAIDLGNTHSCVVGYGPANGQTQTSSFRFCIPSWVAFPDGGTGTVLVGDAAKNHADADPASAIFGLKRLLGLRRNHKYEEEIVQRHMERVPYQIGARDVVFPANDGAVRQLYVEDITSMVIAKLKEKAEHHLGREVRDAVVTIPTHFNDPSTWAAMSAGKFAGLDVKREVPDSIAAADAYGLRRKLPEDGSALVLHVGGATAEASVVTLMDDGYFEIFGNLNDLFLGGDDFDQRIVDYFVDLIKTKHGRDISQDRIALRKLRTACESAKKALSSQDHTQVSVESLFSGMDFSESLSRQLFEELNDDLFHKVMALVESAVEQAELDRSKNKIHEIVLVGGSTMIPKIQMLVKDYFDGRELNMRVKPDEAVGLGAAIRYCSPPDH